MHISIATTLLRPAFGLLRAFGAISRALALDAISAIDGALEHIKAGCPGRDLNRPTLLARVMILSDETGVPLVTPQQLAPALRRAEAILAKGGIRLRVAGINTVGEPAPKYALDPRANRWLLLDHILGRTGFYRQHLQFRSPLSVVGDPITVIVVRNIHGSTTGCSLGASADWVLCQASLFAADNPRRYDETVLAHELGHALNLPHLRDRNNLMYPLSTPPNKVRGDNLRRWQTVLMTANRHVIPPAG